MSRPAIALPSVRELGVVVRAHDLVVAIPARHVVRLVLPDEITVLREGAPGLVEAEGGETFAAWDLGEILGRESLDAAWVLARVPRPGAADLKIALRTGACVVVETLPDALALPSALLATRARAFPAAFPARANHGGALYGLVLDLPRLLSPAEVLACAPETRGAGAS